MTAAAVAHALGALAPLAEYRQFILFQLVPLASGRTDKLPMNYSTGEVCDAHDPAAWTSWETAAAVATRWGAQYRVGFVLTEADDLAVVDIDSCAQPDGTWSALAYKLCASLQPGSVVEVSQSGRGLHVWLRRSRMPPHSKKNLDIHAELYSSKRAICLGSQAVGTMAADCLAIDTVVAKYFPPRDVAPATPLSDGPRADWRGPPDTDAGNAELLRRALQSKSAASAFGNKASFSDLWHADETALGRAFPPDSGSSEPYDRSSADAALAQHLAFWTGRDAARIERLMRQSALAREKWDQRSDYLVERTIANACSMQREVLQDRPSAVPEPAAVTHVAATMTPVEGRTMLSPEEQAKLFDGCVYVIDQHRVLVPGGYLRSPERFRAQFGGYTFTLGGDNSKVTRNAWEAFTESQALRAPRAGGTCFRPDLPFGAIVQEPGRTRVNTYWPVEVPCVEGDPGPYLRHVEKLFPDPIARAAWHAYVARNIQSPGIKAPWAPLIIGVEGNGKTILSRCLQAAVGKRYVHWPKANKVGNQQFNAWLSGKLLYLVEDIHTGGNAELFDNLKTMITAVDLEVEGKGLDQEMVDVCGNFVFNSNRLDALRKTRNDRRLLILLCAQQDVTDLLRDGMDEAYMADLNDWLVRKNGFAIVTHYYRSCAVPPEFDYAGQCQRAPITRGAEEAIVASRNEAEQAIVDAIEADVPGFRGGWVSTVQVAAALGRKRLRMSKTERRQFLESLGYVQHPALGEFGQVSHTVLPDGAKPTLYLKAGHPAIGLHQPADVARAYTGAQTAA